MIAFLLMLVLVFALSACGNTGNIQSSDVQGNKEQTTDVSERELLNSTFHDAVVAALQTGISTSIISG